MISVLRRSAAIGLCLLLTGGVLSPIARASGTPAASPPGDPVASVATVVPPTPTESSGVPAPALPATVPTAGSLPATASGTATYSVLPEDFALEISPTRLAVGQADVTKVQHLEVINRGRVPITVVAQKRGFVGAPDGTMKFEADAPHSATTWVTVTPATLTLVPGRSRVVDITIAVPKDADPGDHEVAIVFVAPGSRKGGNIAVNRGIGTPVYITVPGPIVQAAKLDTLAAKGFALGGGVTFTATLQNTGTVHRDFRGATALEITGAGSVAKFPEFTMMRDSTRTISATWYPPFMCICYPSVSVPQEDGSTQITSVRVIVFPLQWLAALLLGILVLVVVVRLNRRRFRGRVLSAARAMNQAVS